MRIVLNRKHPERRLHLVIGDIVKNETTRDTYQILAWTPCFFIDPPYDSRQHHRDAFAHGVSGWNCDDCPNARILMKVKSRVKITKIHHIPLSSNGYMGSDHWCLGGTRESPWKKEKNVLKPR